MTNSAIEAPDFYDIKPYSNTGITSSDSESTGYILPNDPQRQARGSRIYQGLLSPQGESSVMEGRMLITPIDLYVRGGTLSVRSNTSGQGLGRDSFTSFRSFD